MIVATYISWGNMCKNRSQFSWQSQFCCLQEWAIPCCFFFRMMNGCFFPEMNGRAHPMHFFLERCQYQAHRFDKKAQFWKKKYTNNFHFQETVNYNFCCCRVGILNLHCIECANRFMDTILVFFLILVGFHLIKLRFHLHPHHHIFLWALRIYIMKNLCTPHWILWLVYHYVWSMLYCIEDICHERDIPGTMVLFPSLSDSELNFFSFWILCYECIIQKWFHILCTLGF